MIPYPTTQGLDPAQFSLRDALDVAILIEEEARDRYDELAEQLAVHHTPEAAAFFRRMARIEERHRNQLLERRQTRFSGEASRVRREIDRANKVFTRPFNGLVENSESAWMRRGVPAGLALLLFGAGFAFLARFSKGSSRRRRGAGEVRHVAGRL